MPAARVASSRAQLETSYHPSPAAREPLVGEQVLVGEVVVVGHRQLAAADPPGQRGAVLDDQGVRRDVVGRAGQRRVERGLPVGERLPRRAVDQVEADLLEAGRPRPADHRPGPAPGRGCGRARRSTCGDGRLHAERDPGEAGLAQRPRSPRRTLSGLASVVTSAPGGQPELRRRSRARTAPRSAGLQQGRRAAAEEDRRRPAGRASPSTRRASRTSSIAASAYVVREAPGAPAGGAELVGGVGVEVAVAAADRAERHVHVDPERPLARARPAPSPGGGRRSAPARRRAGRTAPHQCADPMTTRARSA